MKKLKNCRDHPFLEQTLNHLGILYKVTHSYSKAIETYGDLIASKEKYYGPGAEQLVQPLKNLGQCQHMTGAFEESIATFKKSIEIAEKQLATGKPRDPKDMRKHLGEILFTLFSIFDSMQQYTEAHEQIKKHHEVVKEIHGEKSTQYVHSLFLSTKLLLKIKSEAEQNETVEACDKALALEAEVNAKRTTPSPLKGRLLYTKGSAEFTQKKFVECKKTFTEAKVIFEADPEFHELAQMIDKHLEDVDEKIGSNSFNPALIGYALVGLATLGVVGFGVLKYNK